VSSLLCGFALPVVQMMMGRKIPDSVPRAPLYAIIALVAAVWVIEHFARKYLKADAARLGVPLPSAERSLHFTAPEPLPDHWFTGFIPLGGERWLLQDDANHWCFGVLTVERHRGDLTFRMQRRVPFAWPVSLLGLWAFATWAEEDPTFIALIVALYAVGWGGQILRGHLWLGKTLESTAERVKFFSQTSAPAVSAV
jgi:hypothetical protein